VFGDKMARCTASSKSRRTRCKQTPDVAKDRNTSVGTFKSHTQWSAKSMANKHIGSSFDEFLSEEAILQEVTATAMKRVIAWPIAEEKF
jgi:hypothetical protein